MTIFIVDLRLQNADLYYQIIEVFPKSAILNLKSAILVTHTAAAVPHRSQCLQIH